MKQIFIESSYQSFEDFHDGKWYEDIFRSADGSPIQSAIEDFAMHWWGASRAFVLPWLLVGGVFDASNGGGGETQSKQELWEKYMEVNSFKGALWKTAENAYGSIYYAYENLLVSILNANLREPVRVTQRDFNAVVARSLGKSLAGKVWSNNFVATAKEVRNCLVHRGGKASARLLAMNPQPRIADGDILISASDVRILQFGLKQRVGILIAAHTKRGSGDNQG